MEKPQRLEPWGFFVGIYGKFFLLATATDQAE